MGKSVNKSVDAGVIVLSWMQRTRWQYWYWEQKSVVELWCRRRRRLDV